MVFTVLGAVAELERSLIVERVKAGLRNARAKGKVLGRPKRVLDPKQIASYALRASAGRRSRERWGLGSERCIGLPQTVPKFGKRFFEPEPLPANGLRLPISP